MLAQSIPKKTRLLFLLDASGSMYAQMGTDNRINIAKRLLSKMADSLSIQPNIEIALRVYGHQTPKDKRNCMDTKLEVPFSKNNLEAIKSKLKTIRPLGTTLIAYSLKEAAYDFPKDVNYRNVIILITDGIEECNGDPCAVSLALQQQGVILRPFIIGVGLDKSFETQFECVGRFFDARTEEMFEDVLKVVISQAVNNTTLQVNLLDLNGRPTETDVSMTFYDAKRGVVCDNFVHTIADNGLPDTITIDPVNKYNIVVHTIPPVIKKDVEIYPGKHNVVAIDAPQGSLKLVCEGNYNYNRLQCVIRKAGTSEIIHIQDFNTKENLIIGNYDIDILSTPKILKQNININQSTTTTVEIPNPGKVNINSRANVTGGIYRMVDNKLELVINLNKNLLAQSMSLQPGKYKIIARAMADKKTLKTKRIDFEIKSGQNTNINIL